MSEIMRVGIAGLGTVGAAVARLLRRQAEALTARTGRRIVLAGVSARDATKERRADLSSAEFFQDPVKLAASPSIDLFVELIGG
ncbi:MAG: homoserine dehydrogenase, partial [Methylocystis silviterrae]